MQVRGGAFLFALLLYLLQGSSWRGGEENSGTEG